MFFHFSNHPPAPHPAAWQLTGVGDEQNVITAKSVYKT
jgi:hypothetical protein